MSSIKHMMLTVGDIPLGIIVMGFMDQGDKKVIWIIIGFVLFFVKFLYITYPIVWIVCIVIHILLFIKKE